MREALLCLGQGERDTMSPATIGLDLLLVLVLVLANGLFVAAELALVSSRRTRMEQLAADGNRMAKVVRTAMERPVTFIAGTQVGITLASLPLLPSPSLSSPSSTSCWVRRFRRASRSTAPSAWLF